MGPLLFFIYINDLNQAIKFSRVHQFADNTNLLLADNSLKKINTLTRANRISLNTSKTEILLFRPKSKGNITKQLNFRISVQYIPQTTQVKHLGLTMNERLDWDLYFIQLKMELNHWIGLLAKKKRHFTPKQLLKTLFFSLFHSNLIYGCQIWGQDQNKKFKKIEKLQEKAIRIINFLPLNAPVGKQMYEMNVLKLKDFIILQNILFVKDCLS